MHGVRIQASLLFVVPLAGVGASRESGVLNRALWLRGENS
jgi:hypothetical protein